MLKTDKVHSVFRERDLLINNKTCLFLSDLYHTFTDDENLYLVMEYIEGGTLEDFLKKFG